MSNINDFVSLNKVLCNVVGLWPIDQEASSFDRAFAHVRVMLSLIAINNVFIPELMAIGVRWGDLQVLTGVGCVTITVGQVLFKIFYLTSKRKEVDKLYFTISDFWQVTTVPHERKSFERFAKLAKIFTIVFLVAGMGNVFMFTTAAVVEWVINSVNESTFTKCLPFDVWYGFDIQATPIFEISFILQIVSSLICCTGIVGLDAFMMTMIIHVCGQFRLVQTWYRDLGLKIDNFAPNDQEITFSEKNSEFLNVVQSDVKRCIHHHQRIIGVADQLERLFGPIIFMQFITSALEICLSGYAMSSGVGSKMDMFKFLNYLMSMLVQLLVWCWPGELLIQESGHVGIVVFCEVPWYKLPKSLQKDLLMVVVRSQKTCQITAAKFQEMSFSTLAQIFSSAGSYFALLRQMRDAQNENSDANI